MTQSDQSDTRPKAEVVLAKALRQCEDAYQVLITAEEPTAEQAIEYLRTRDFAGRICNQISAEITLEQTVDMVMAK